MAKFYNYKCPLCGVIISELQSQKRFEFYKRNDFIFAHSCPNKEPLESVNYELISESPMDLKRSDVVVINDNNFNIYRIYRFSLSNWEKYIPEKGYFEDVGTSNNEILEIIKGIDEV